MAVAAVDTNDFTRITIYQNFGTGISALLVDGVVVLQDLAFPGSSVNYDTFEVQNVESSPAYLDSFSAGTSVPSALTSEAQELHDNGYVARNLTVGDTASEDFASSSSILEDAGD